MGRSVPSIRGIPAIGTSPQRASGRRVECRFPRQSILAGQWTGGLAWKRSCFWRASCRYRRMSTWKSMLAGLPKQTLQDEHALVWLDQGDVSASRTRGPKFFDAAQLNDPVLKTQKLIAERLRPYFPLIRAVSFANKGSVP